MEEQLPQLEQLATAIYAASSNEEKKKAVEALQGFQTSLDYIGHCKLLLEKSNSPYALLFASSSLCEAITSNWNTFSQDIQSSIDLRNYLLGYLWNKYTSLEKIVSKSIAKLLARVTKLGWDSDERHQQLPQQLSKFFESSVEHQTVGFLIANALIDEVNERYISHTIAVHRKISSTFREDALLSIFDRVIENLKQVVSREISSFSPAQEALLDQSIVATLNCLNFDFFGSGIYSSDDMGIVQVPSSWKSRIVDGVILEILFKLYGMMRPPHSTRVMESISLLSSVRSSLFDSMGARTSYLSKLISGICALIENKIGLVHAENHHQLCRVLARIKSSHQLAQLTRVSDFERWIRLVCDFSCKTFQSWQWSPNSIYYLLSLWSRLVTASRNLKKEECSFISSCAISVVEVYISSRVESVVYLMRNPDQDDPLDEEDHLQEQLETLPYIIRCAYPQMNQQIQNLLNPLTAEFQRLLAGGDRNELAIVEGKLAWLIYIIGAILGGRLHMCSTSESESLDGDLASHVLRLQNIHNQRLSNLQPTPHSVHLELAFLSFTFQFRHVYVGDKSGVGTTILSRISDNLSIQGAEQLMEHVVRKIITNLNYWSDASVIRKTLEIFDNLINGYLSLKRLARLPIVEAMLTHHTAQHFPFLNVPDNSASRTTFYRSLSRLLFLDKNINKFPEFIAPFSQNFNILVNQSSVEALKQDQCKKLFVGLLRDLTGVFFGCQTKAQYEKVWDWIYPTFVNIIAKGAGLLYDCPAVTSPLLKLGIQMATNRGGRLDFGCSSANGILLFREISNIIVQYGTNIAKVVPPVTARYQCKLKGIYLALKMLVQALSGNYVNFAIFELYGDPCLSNALNVCMELSREIQQEDLSSYPKLAESYFNFLQYLCKNHLKYVLQLDSPFFMQIIMFIREGLNHQNSSFSQCCAMVESLATFYYENRGKESDMMKALLHHLQGCPEMFTYFLQTLFQVLLFVPSANHWTISGALFALILLDTTKYNKFVEEIIATQPAERRNELVEAFSGIMLDINDNLQPTNRERFTRNLTIFKQKTKSIIVL